MSREIDTLIAEKVMGGIKKVFNGVEMRFKPDGSGDVKHVYVDHIPPYSTDIAAAWKVAEKLKAEKWLFHVTSNDEIRFAIGTVPAPTGWFAHFWKFGTTHGPSIADSAPLCICLAALKAVGHEVG